MAQSVRGLAENMLQARIEDELLSTKELQGNLYRWPLATCHEHILMTVAAFGEF